MDCGSDSAGLVVSLRQTQPIALAVDLTCRPGQVLALVGPSGSGKSTVLRCIAGLHHPTEGRVNCDGVQWLNTERRLRLSPQRRRVGFVFQHYALFPHMSAAENVAAAIAGGTRESAIRKAAELLHLVNMEGLEHRRPAALSGGQRQRVAFARALAREPSVLLLDEPFSAVDQMTRARLRRELAQLRSAVRVPLVLVTHDLDEALLLSDRISLLHHGRTIQSGLTSEVMSRPVSAEAARLLDHRNLFRARVSRHDAERRRTWIEWAGVELECAHYPEFTPGSEVSWLIPQSGVVMHRRDRPSRGERENPVAGRAGQLTRLGEEVLVELNVAGESRPLSFALSVHIARRNGLAVGARVGVSLLSDALHLMPLEHAPDD